VALDSIWVYPHTMTKKHYFFIVIIAAFAGFSRFFQFENNLTAFGAAAFLLGFFFWKSPETGLSNARMRLFSVSVFFISLLLTDLWMGLHSVMPSVYGAFLIYFLIGNFFSTKVPSALNLVSGATLGSISFFLLTNLAVWSEGILYPMSWYGLVDCFIAALPFYRGQLVGDVGYTVVGGLLLSQVLKIRTDIFTAEPVTAKADRKN